MTLDVQLANLRLAATYWWKVKKKQNLIKI